MCTNTTVAVPSTLNTFASAAIRRWGLSSYPRGSL